MSSSTLMEAEPSSRLNEVAEGDGLPETRLMLAVSLVVILAGWIRLYHFSDVHSWFDESLGWRMSQFSFAEIIARSERNVHPPMHFLLLSVWRDLFGGSILALRSYALVWGLGTAAGAMCLVYAALEKAERPRDRLLGATLSGLLVALSPLHIHWSQQIKMYSLGTCLTVWSSWLLLRWMQTMRTRCFILYVPLAVALSLQHHYGTLTVFAQLTFVGSWAAIESYRDKQWSRLITSAVAGWATFSLWALWLPSFLAQRNLVKAGYWIGDFRWRQAVTVWGHLFTEDTGVRLGSTASWMAAEIVFFLILSLLIANNTYGRFIAWLAVVPYALALAWSVLSENVFVPRFLINAQLCLLCGVGVLLYSLRLAPVNFILSLILICGFGYLAMQQREHRERQASVPGMPAAISILQGARVTHEPVLVCNPMLYLNVCAHNQSAGLERLYAYDPGYVYPHFQGTPVMRAEEYYGVDDLARDDCNWVWTLDASNWLGGDWKVRLPQNWEPQGETRIKEWYGTLVIRSYRRRGSNLQANQEVRR